MALKDWRKINSNTLFDYYERKDNERQTHLTVSNEEDDVVIGKGKRFGYLVAGFKRGKETRKVFYTKSQAMAFARSYMRNH